jgi:hypothetical protein
MALCTDPATGRQIRLPVPNIALVTAKFEIAGVPALTSFAYGTPSQANGGLLRSIGEEFNVKVLESGLMSLFSSRISYLGCRVADMLIPTQYSVDVPSNAVVGAKPQEPESYQTAIRLRLSTGRAGKSFNVTHRLPPPSVGDVLNNRLTPGFAAQANSVLQAFFSISVGFASGFLAVPSECRGIASTVLTLSVLTTIGSQDSRNK